MLKKASSYIIHNSRNGLLNQWMFDFKHYIDKKKMFLLNIIITHIYIFIGINFNFKIAIKYDKHDIE